MLAAWEEFAVGKRGRADAQEFEFALMDNLLALRRRLADGSYRHGAYEAFAISDPKPRQIHKATVSDRVLHRALYRQLYPAFDRTFISDSFSCRVGKGTHAALDRFRTFAGRVSLNDRRTAWILKCDVRKFSRPSIMTFSYESSTGGSRISESSGFWKRSFVASTFSRAGDCRSAISRRNFWRTYIWTRSTNISNVGLT